MDQSRASDHRSHQDAGSNESHLRLGKWVVGNDQQNQDWVHLLLPISQERRVHPADQWTTKPPARHPNVRRSAVRKLTWSPHISTMHSKPPRKIVLMKKLAGTKWGANMKTLTRVYTATVRSHMEYTSNAWSSAARTNLDQLIKTQNAGLRIITGGMKTTPMDSRLAVIRGKERGKTPALKWKDEEASFTPITFQVWGSHQNRLKRQSPNQLVKAFQQKHKLPSSARNWKCFRTMTTGKQKLQPSF